MKSMMRWLLNNYIIVNWGLLCVELWCCNALSGYINVIMMIVIEKFYDYNDCVELCWDWSGLVEPFVVALHCWLLCWVVGSRGTNDE